LSPDFQGICELDCKPHAPSGTTFDRGLNAKFAPGYSDFLCDVKKEKEAIGRFLHEFAPRGEV
jgi:hypothetical protein